MSIPTLYIFKTSFLFCGGKKKWGGKKEKEKEKGHFSTFPCSPGHPVFPRYYLPLKTISVGFPLAPLSVHNVPLRDPEPAVAFSFYQDNVDGSEAVSQAKVGVTPRSFSAGKEGRGDINPRYFASNMFCNSHSDAIIAN